MDQITAFIFARATVCLFGIGTNALLICATFNLKRPLNICTWLIAADALTVLLYSSSGLISLGLFLAFQSQFRLANCIPFQILPLAGFTLNRATIFCISLDRFLSVLLPIWYKHGRNCFIYLSTLSAISFAYLAANLFLIIQEDIRQAEIQVWCAMTDLFQGLNGPISQSILGLSLVSVLFYILIWAKLKRTKKNQAAVGSRKGPNYTERILTSLMVIMGTILFGYILTSGFKTLLNAVQFSSNTAYMLTSGSSLVSVLTSGCHPLILYAFSKEYRLAINKCLALKCGVQTQNSISAIPSTGLKAQNPNSRQHDKIIRQNSNSRMVTIG